MRVCTMLYYLMQSFNLSACRLYFSFYITYLPWVYSPLPTHINLNAPESNLE